jgi:hypothetical protein
MNTVQLTSNFSTIHFEFLSTFDQTIEINEQKYLILGPPSQGSIIYLQYQPTYTIKYSTENDKNTTKQWTTPIHSITADSILTVNIKFDTIETQIYLPFFQCQYSDLNFQQNITTEFVSLSLTNKFQCPIPAMMSYLLTSIRRCDFQDQCSIIDTIVPVTPGTGILYKYAIITNVIGISPYGRSIQIQGLFDDSGPDHISYQAIFVNERTQIETRTEWMNQFTSLKNIGILIKESLNFGDIQYDDYYQVHLLQRVSYDHYSIIDQSNTIIVQYKAPIYVENLWEFQQFQHTNTTNNVYLENNSPDVTYSVYSDIDRDIKINTVPVRIYANQTTIQRLPYTNIAVIEYDQMKLTLKTNSEDEFVFLSFTNSSHGVSWSYGSPTFRCVYTDIAGKENITTSNTYLDDDNILTCRYPWSSPTHYLGLTYLFTGVIKCIPMERCDINHFNYFIYPPTPILIYDAATIEHNYLETEITFNEPIIFTGKFDPAVEYYCQYSIRGIIIDLKSDIPHPPEITSMNWSAYNLICNTSNIVPFNQVSNGMKLNEGDQFIVDIYQIINYKQPIITRIDSIKFTFRPAIDDNKMSKSTLIGIIVGCILGAIVIISAIIYCRRRSINKYNTNRNPLLQEDALVQ